MNQGQEYSPEEIEDLQLKSTQIHDLLFANPVDEMTFSDILCATTNEERQLIRGFYKKSYGHPIQNDFKAQLKDNLRQLSIDMFDTPYEYDARELHTALNSLTNDDSVIIEIFSSRPSTYLDIVDKAYNNFYKISLKEEVKKQCGGEFADFLIALMEVERPNEQTISGSDAYDYAEELKNGGLTGAGTDVEKFKNIFVDKSREDLILISRAYYEKSKKNLYDAIENEVPGKNRSLLKAIIFAIITPAQFFAKKIAKARISNDNNTIRRVLISRSEIDMYAIRDYYYMENNNELRNDIQDEDSEDVYGAILINLSLK
jgi:hypothetical protein